VKRIAWVQDEPANMGAWAFVRAAMEDTIGVRPERISRPAAGSPATGCMEWHKDELRTILDEAFACE
jgi:2-oxoglutarate dehydrogenase E1 component